MNIKELIETSYQLVYKGNNVDVSKVNDKQVDRNSDEYKRAEAVKIRLQAYSDQVSNITKSIANDLKNLKVSDILKKSEQLKHAVEVLKKDVYGKGK